MKPKRKVNPKVRSMNNSDLDSIKNKLRGTKKHIIDLSNIIDTVNPSYFDSIVKWINSNGIIRDRVFHKPFPKSLHLLKVHQPLLPTSIKRELLWVTAYLKPYLNRINAFVEIKERLNLYLIEKKYEQCKEILDHIEQEYGQSLWLIKCKTAILQSSEGLEAHKNYINHVKESVLVNGVAGFISHYVSYRNEATVSTYKFKSTYVKVISNSKAKKPFICYLHHHIMPEIDLDEDSIATILRYENAGAIIDLYEAFIFSLQAILVNKNESLFPFIKQLLAKLKVNLQDNRIYTLSCELDSECVPDLTNSVNYMAPLEHYLAGKSDDSFNIAIKNLKKDLLNIKLIQLVAIIKSENTEKYHTGDLSINYLITTMISVINKDANMQKSIEELRKMSLNYNFSPWAYELTNFISNEYTSSVVNSRIQNEYYSLLNNGVSTPEGIVALDMSNISHSCYVYLKQREEYCCVTCCIELQLRKQVDLRRLDCLNSDVADKIAATIYYEIKDYSNAIEKAVSLVSSPHRPYRLFALRVTTNSFINENKIKQCLVLIVETLLKDGLLYGIIPLKECVESIDGDVYDSLKDEICLSIAYEMYNKYIENKFGNKLAYAYEDFLLSNGISRPTQIKGKIELQNSSKIKYYLRYVCLESVMDSSIEFDGSRDILEERLAICKMIADNSEKHDEMLQAEIKDLLRRLMVHKRIREIEQSKIYVDIESIRKTAEKEIKDGYGRYLSFVKQGFNQESVTYSEKLREKIQKGDIAGIISLPLPANEMYDLFESMVVYLRDEFVSSSEHGLDGYLSVRIRHGTLSSQLRSPLDACNLITKKDSNTDSYIENEFWNLKYYQIDDYSRDTLNGSLNNFSKNYDILIDDIITNIVQVKKESADKGMFDFTLRKSSINLLSQRITDDTSFEEFINTVFDFLYQILDISLIDIRNEINGKVKAKINTIFDTLHADISPLECVYNIGELNNTIMKVRTEVQNSIDRFAEWFTLSNIVSDEPFTIEDAVNISLETIRAYTKKFNIDLVIDGELPLIHGKYLSSFVDILYIVFENIVRHSGVEDLPTAGIHIIYNKNELKLRVENVVSEDVDTTLIRNKITSIKTTMAEGLYKANVKKEGGTGFYKIRKILTHDFHSKSKLDFGILDEQKFFVDITIFVKEIDYENANC